MGAWSRPEGIKMCESRNKKDGRQKIFLVGIGMGTAEGLTGQANEAVRRCQCLIGAKRMLQTVRDAWGGFAVQGAGNRPG